MGKATPTKAKIIPITKAVKMERFLISWMRSFKPAPKFVETIGCIACPTPANRFWNKLEKEITTPKIARADSPP